MKFAICNELFEDREHAEVCRVVAELGYDGLELAPFTLAPTITELSAERRAAVRAQAEDAGLRIIGLHWLLAKTEGLHLTSPDPAVRRATASYLVELGRACRDLGGDVMVFGSPPQRSLQPGVSREHGFELAAEVFAAAMPGIADCGVELCIEPLSPAETDFINTCAEGIELVDRVAHPSFALHLDVKAMSSEPTPVPELIAAHIDRARHFHANDPNLLGPGMGEVDFAPIFAALADGGYDRWVSVEVFDYSPGPEVIARQSIECMRRCTARLAS